MATENGVECSGQASLLEEDSEKGHLGELDEQLEKDFENPNEPSAETMELDEFFGILSNSRRRTVIRYMSKNQDEAPFKLGPIAEEIAVIENDKDSVSALKSQERKRVYVALQQAHIDKIEDYGAIDYNKNRSEIDFANNNPNNPRFSELADFVKQDVRPANQDADEDYFENLGDNLTDEYSEGVTDQTYLTRFFGMFRL